MSSYYELLELDTNASDNDIKKAYRRQAIKWHPDKNPNNREQAEARFKQVSEAYEVLKDERQRGLYDQLGHDGYREYRTGGGGGGGSSGYRSQGSGGMPGGFPGFMFGGGGFGRQGSGTFQFHDPRDIFAEVFGSDDPFAAFFEGNYDFCEFCFL